MLFKFLFIVNHLDHFMEFQLFNSISLALPAGDARMDNEQIDKKRLRSHKEIQGSGSGSERICTSELDADYRPARSMRQAENKQLQVSPSDAFSARCSPHRILIIQIYKNFIYLIGTFTIYKFRSIFKDIKKGFLDLNYVMINLGQCIAVISEKDSSLPGW